MDPDIVVLIYVIALALWVIAFFAILRIFSIDKTLKQILKRMPGEPTKEPESSEATSQFSTAKQIEEALRGK